MQRQVPKTDMQTSLTTVSLPSTVPCLVTRLMDRRLWPPSLSLPAEEDLNSWSLGCRPQLRS